MYHVHAIDDALQTGSLGDSRRFAKAHSIGVNSFREFAIFKGMRLVFDSRSCQECGEPRASVNATEDRPFSCGKPFCSVEHRTIYANRYN